MRYGEDYWTPSEAEDGLVPHNAVWDPASGVYRDVIEDGNDDDEEAALPHSPLRSTHKVRALTAEQLGLSGPEEDNT